MGCSYCCDCFLQDTLELEFDLIHVTTLFFFEDFVGEIVAPNEFIFKNLVGAEPSHNVVAPYATELIEQANGAQFLTAIRDASLACVENGKQIPFQGRGIEPACSRQPARPA